MTKQDGIKEVLFDLKDIKYNLEHDIKRQPLSTNYDGTSYTINEALTNAILFLKNLEVIEDTETKKQHSKRYNKHFSRSNN